MLVGFFVLGFDTGSEVVETDGEDGDVACWIGVFAHSFFPERVVSGIHGTSVEANLVGIYEVVEVILATKTRRQVKCAIKST